MPFDERWNRIAERQFGVLSTRQAGSDLRSPRLERVYNGVRRVRGAPITLEQHVLAVQLATPRAAMSHATCGRLWRIDGVSTALIEVIVPWPQDCRLPGVVTHRSRTLEPEDVTRLGSMRVTTVQRMLIDIAGVSAPTVLELALDDAYRRGLVRMSALADRLERIAPNTRGTGRLRALVEERRDQPPKDSGLETIFAAAMRDRNAPMPVLHFEIHDSAGRIAEVDYAYPDRRVAIELNGLKWHIGRERFENDHEKRLALRDAGWELLEFTHRMVRYRTKKVVQRVLREYGRRPAL